MEKTNIFKRPGLWGKSNFSSRSKGWILQTRPLPQRELSVAKGYRQLKGIFGEAKRVEKGTVRTVRPVAGVAAKGAIGLGKTVYGGISRRIERAKLNRKIDVQIKNAQKTKIQKPSIYGSQPGKFGFEGMKKPKPKTQFDSDTDVSI